MLTFLTHYPVGIHPRLDQGLVEVFRMEYVVLLAHEKVSRGQWPLGVMEDVKTGRDGHVRSCVVKTKDSKAVKPITRLCLLEGSN